MAKSITKIKLQNNQPLTKKGGGFTLLEALIYISLVSAITIVFTSFTADVISSSVRSLAAKEVNQSARLVMSRISQEIKSAREITSVTANEIILTNYANETVIFNYDSVNELVNINLGSGNVQISNSSVRVTELSFEEVADNTIKLRIAVDQKKINPTDKEKSHIDLETIIATRASLY